MGTEFRGSVFQIPWIFPMQRLIFSLNIKSYLMLPNNSSPQNSSWFTKTQHLPSHFSPLDALNAPWKLEMKGVKARLGNCQKKLTDWLAYGTHWATLQSSMNRAWAITPCIALSLAGSENDFLAHQKCICLSRRTQINKNSKTYIHKDT